MQSLIAFLEHYGYLAIFLLIMFEDFGMPAPGETALILGSVAAAAGKLNIWGVLIAAFLGAVVGDNIGFAIGRYGGRKLVLRVGGRVGITHERLRYAEGFFRKYGDVVVAGARFVEVLRQLNGIIAGTMDMNWATFTAFNALGAALWVGVWGAIGYFAGENLYAIERWLMRFSWLALMLIAIAVIAWVIYRRSHEHTAPVAGSAAVGAPVTETQDTGAADAQLPTEDTPADGV